MAVQQKPQVVEISVERFSFTPSEFRVKAGAPVEIRLRSDDTDHGFRIVGTDINVDDSQARQRRRDGDVRAAAAGKVRLRMLEALRRRSFVHARLAHRRVGGHLMRTYFISSLSPLAGLLAAAVDGADTERAGHAAGRASRPSSSRSSASASTTFSKSRRAKKGLGPAFNGTSCAVCHNIPTIGGAGTMAELRAGRRNANGEFETLDASGDTLFHMFSVPGHGCQPVLPADTNVFARRVPIPLFGAGLVEAIPDETLLALEDPNDRNGDGVSGRAALVVDVETGERRVGRFGWKAQHATLITFGADAYRNEMGITNDLFPQESAFGITADQMRLCDPFSDPEDIRDPRSRRRGIDNFASFMRFLAPAGRGRHERPGSGWRAGLRRYRLHGVPHPDPRDRAERESALPSEDSRVVFRSSAPRRRAPATASSKARRSRTRSARRPCGACVFGVRSSTTEPRRWKKRS